MVKDIYIKKLINFQVKILRIRFTNLKIISFLLKYVDIFILPSFKRFKF